MSFLLVSHASPIRKGQVSCGRQDEWGFEWRRIAVICKNRGIPTRESIPSPWQPQWSSKLPGSRICEGSLHECMQWAHLLTPLYICYRGVEVMDVHRSYVDGSNGTRLGLHWRWYNWCYADLSILYKILLPISIFTDSTNYLYHSKKRIVLDLVGKIYHRE